MSVLGPIFAGGYVELGEGMRMRLSKQPDGRLAVFNMVGG